MRRDRLYLSTMDENAASLARREGLGLELTAFAYAPNLEDAARLAAAQSQLSGLSRAWLHAPFAELFPCAVDPMAREVAMHRYRQTLAVADRLGIRRLVVHAGYLPYVYFPEWFVAQSVEFWRELLRELPQDVCIALENVLEPSAELLVEIVRQVADPRLGLCLDVGHANTEISRVPPVEWIEPMAPWLLHFHLHNNFGGSDLHKPLGEGTIPMAALLETAQRLCPNASFTVETQNCAASLAWLREIGELS